MNNLTNANNTNRFLCTNYNVLIADENADNRKMVKDAFYAYGVSLDEADSVELTVKLAKEHSFDMILISENFSGDGESGVAKTILADCTYGRIVPVMIELTAQAEYCAGDEFRRKGFCEALALPVDEGLLYQIMNKWIPEGKKNYLENAKQDGGMTDIEVAQLFMAGVDVIGALEQIGSIEDYLDLLEVFYIDGQTRRASLEEKIETQDILNFTIEVHGLKSAAANIGAMTLSALSKKHEDAGNATDLGFIGENKSALFDCYEKILEEIRRVLTQIGYGRFAETKADAEGLEAPALLARLREGLEFLEDFHSKDAASVVEELLGYSLDEPVKAGLEEINTLLKVYEDDKAEDALREMISGLEQAI